MKVLVSQSCVTLCYSMIVARQAPLPMELSRQAYKSGLPYLLQGIFPIQRLNLSLLHCRQILYHLSDNNSSKNKISPTTFSSVQSLSRVRLFVTPWTAASQASLSITNSRSSLKFMSIESVMPSSHLVLCCPLLLLPQIPPSIRVFSNESALRIRFPSIRVSASTSVLPRNTIQPSKKRIK